MAKEPYERSDGRSLHECTTCGERFWITDDSMDTHAGEPAWKCECGNWNRPDPIYLDVEVLDEYLGE